MKSNPNKRKQLTHFVAKLSWQRAQLLNRIFINFKAKRDGIWETKNFENKYHLFLYVFSSLLIADFIMFWDIINVISSGVHYNTLMHTTLL